MMTRFRTVALWLAVAVFAMPGCTWSGDAPAVDDRVDMAASELVGTWTNNSFRTVIGFAADGRFVADGLPHAMFADFSEDFPPGFDKDRDRINAEGTWELTSPRVDPGAPHNKVQLHVETLMGRQSRGSRNLTAEQIGGEVVLVSYTGDPLVGKIYFRSSVEATRSP